MSTARARWARELAAWEIPAEILASAPVPPWSFPTHAFVHAAERALERARPSERVAAEALPQGGSVLDVGSGAGAGSLPLAARAGLLVAVDESEEMLAAFAAGAGERGVDHREVQGRWPDLAGRVGPADVVVCHHVLYNVADLVPFVRAMDSHARRRVVVELTDRHPMVPLNHVWKAIHGVDRPGGPSAADAVAVLEEMELPVRHFSEDRPSVWAGAGREGQVAFVRRRLCVGPERDADIERLLGDGLQEMRTIVAMWWDTHDR